MCGFRPFFVLTAASAVVMMAVWLLMLRGLLPATMPGGSLFWHSHELIFGFVTASIAGFVLTAIPEFTKTRPIGRPALLRLTLLWIATRLAYALAGLWPSWLGLWPAALFNLALWVLLLMQVTPPVWRDPERRHLSFFWGLAAMALLQVGYFVALAVDADAMAWLRVTVGVVMMLIVIAASRVSMSVVNGLIEQGRPGQPDPGDVGYLARPPRRNLAIFCIGACSMTEFALGHDPVTGWTALAAAAAMLNLLNDWHVGRPLFTRWALMMYAFYWLIAVGYALMGAAWLGAPLLPSAGRHVLMAGAMGLSIFTIMALVGRIHSGLWLDRRPWLPVTAALLVLATLLRAAAGAGPAAQWALALIAVSGALWAACFAIYLAVAWPVLTGPRADGLAGCDEPMDRDAGHAGDRPC
ncbi:NnrS family protein [Alcaligenaceae bacterium]|nr:NnrS family protein [Alcaligenaceae bacterium]